MPPFRLPRLLPVTIAVLALVLVAKAEALVRFAITAANLLRSSPLRVPPDPRLPARPRSQVQNQLTRRRSSRRPPILRRSRTDRRR